MPTNSIDWNALRKEGYRNPVFFLKTFLADWFPGRVPWVHYGIAAIYTKRVDFLLEFNEEYGPRELDKILRHFVWKDADSGETVALFELQGSLQEPENITLTLGRHTMVMLPRGFSKTTLLMGIVAWRIVYQETDFDMLVSATQSHADTSLGSIAKHIASNAMFQKAFGMLKPAQRGSVKWAESSGEITTTTGVSLKSRGAGSQIRGQNIDAKRPKMIIVDDLEDKETVATEAQRTKLKNWFFSDLKYALPRLDKESSIVVLATLLHREALTSVMMADPEYNVVVFGAIDPDGDPLWEEALSLEEFEKDKASMAAKGLLAQFYMENMNEIRNTGQDSIKEEHIVVQPRNPADAVQLAIALDPAISKRAGSDFAAIAVVGMMPEGVMHLFEIWMKHGASPRELVDKFFELRRTWGLHAHSKHGIEAQAYQASLVHTVKEEMFRKSALDGVNQYFEVTPITHNSDKELRIRGVLFPRYYSGYITHQRPFGLYNTQLLDFPNDKLDGPDAVAMGISLLDDTAVVAGGSSPQEDAYPPLDEVVGGSHLRY